MPFATSSDALVTRSDGLQHSSFLLLVVRQGLLTCPLLLVDVLVTRSDGLRPSRWHGVPDPLKMILQATKVFAYRPYSQNTVGSAADQTHKSAFRATVAYYAQLLFKLHKGFSSVNNDRLPGQNV